MSPCINLHARVVILGVLQILLSTHVTRRFGLNSTAAAIKSPFQFLRPEQDQKDLFSGCFILDSRDGVRRFLLIHIALRFLSLGIQVINDEQHTRSPASGNTRTSLVASNAHVANISLDRQ